MRSAGLEAQCFPSGTEFLDSLSTREPLCVVLDLHMPGMSGFEVQTRLAQSWPRIPVIIVTGHHTAESHAQALSMRPAAYLQKPVDEQFLLHAIELATK